MEEKRTRKLDGLPEPFLASLEKRYGQIDYKNDFVSIDLDNYYKYQGTDKQTGQVSHKVIALPSFKNLYLHYEDLVQDVKELQGKEGVREDKRARELFELIKTNFRKLQRYLREERPEQYQAVRTKYNETAIESLTTESLRDWFKKEKWVRISSSGNIAGDCGTSKNKKNPDRCLPKAKAQSLSKAERAATARKKKKAGAKGKTVVKNTKKAKVTRENLKAAINILKEEKDYAPYLEQIIDRLKSLDVSIDYLSAAITDQSAFGVSLDQDSLKRLATPAKRNKMTRETSNPQDGKAAPFGSGYKKADKFAGSDPKAGSTIKGTGFDWKRVTKEDIRNLVVGLINEDQEEVLMEKDDRCTRLAKQKYDTWPSAYASGAVVRCRKGKIWKKKK